MSSNQEDRDSADEEENAEDGHEGRDLDTQQPEGERRRVRTEYRELLAFTEANRSELDAEQLLETIQKADSLFRDVYTTHEATLDSKVLVAAADLGVQKAQRMRLDGGSFNIDDWMGKLVVRMNGQAAEESNEDDADDGGPALDWHALGKVATRCLARVPTIDFMLGPLAIEPKLRNANRKVAKLVKNKEDLQKPQQLKESDFEKQENETTGLVMQIAARLHEVGCMSFFEFVINPDSFGQTVENLFYVSFLIRDGKVQVHEDDDGELILEPAHPPRAEDYEDNEIKRFQAVVDIDQPTWRALISAYGITESCIPTRPPTSFAAASGRWYG
ncbi:hypothetical protein PhCBS80983_g00718 [Powellomyces hirtus]|uniref:Non-structural maintenance of chromosomes element 4 n=1 Tax=Powellomyces hirtus TaxID=109895 RepID=A0A507EE07_9FUNG|nr:hypothetical protein PhCBS80983_g00718 [Powellomyces hirtus]